MQIGDTVLFVAENNSLHPAQIVGIDNPEQLDLLVNVSSRGDGVVILQRIDDVMHDAQCSNPDSWHFVNESLGPSVGARPVTHPAIDEVADMRARLADMERLIKMLGLSNPAQISNGENVPENPPTTGTVFVPSSS